MVISWTIFSVILTIFVFSFNWFLFYNLVFSILLRLIWYFSILLLNGGWIWCLIFVLFFHFLVFSTSTGVKLWIQLNNLFLFVTFLFGSLIFKILFFISMEGHFSDCVCNVFIFVIWVLNITPILRVLLRS